MISHSQLNPVPISSFGYDIQGGIPSPIVNVREMGAKGDGRTDDTAAFQAAVDAVPLIGGTLVVPRGDYRINVERSITLHSNMLLLMDPAATLAAIPTKNPLHRLIRVWFASNVRIVGGRLVGERRLHVTEPDAPEGKDEQGFGISIQSSHNIVVSDVHISDFWGDGIWLGAFGAERDEYWDELPEYGNHPKQLQSTNVLINHVVCTHNRRQGLSMGPAENITIMNSTFAFAGPGFDYPQDGTPPMAGIDIEPALQGVVRNVTFSHCTFMRNRGTGLEIHGNVLGVSAHDCLCSDNFGHGFLVRELTGEKEVIGLTFSNNIVSRNGLVGMMVLDQTDSVLLAGNTFMGNGFRYPIPADENIHAEWSSWPWRNVPIPPGIIDIDGEPDPERSREPDLLVERTATNVRFRNNTYTNSGNNDPVDEEWGDPIGRP
ncbi:right-handed parallel beta-helix repeat-containing protein [Dyella sp.]|uniref:right-handed parallel beta-helix repeat-containing protein n=1 Tax=Dyella sp. TaxID=1869338 RepID=UPI002FDB5581